MNVLININLNMPGNIKILRNHIMKPILVMIAANLRYLDGRK